MPDGRPHKCTQLHVAVVNNGVFTCTSCIMLSQSTVACYISRTFNAVVQAQHFPHFIVQQREYNNHLRSATPPHPQHTIQHNSPNLTDINITPAWPRLPPLSRRTPRTRKCYASTTSSCTKPRSSRPKSRIRTTRRMVTCTVSTTRAGRIRQSRPFPFVCTAIS